ncbi:GntR family transcriptional regulator [Actinophytocola sp.]|uniref:GntR family transcriptional regulator n=1 Tax=Actinophytocola sp. TaxID=1872138 RepID=UPI002EDAF239
MDSLAPVSSSTLADQVYARLRAAVQDGSLRRGEKITERGLAARLQVSPTPVREALRQLIHERVVERAGTRALRIADYDAATMDEIAETEARLAGLAARFAARKRTDVLVAELTADLAETDPLVARLERGEGTDDLAEVLAILRRFHRRIEDAARNPVMDALLAQSRVFSDEERYTRTLDRIHAAPDKFAERYRQHRELLGLLAAGDEDEAESLAVRHRLTALRHLGQP